MQSGVVGIVTTSLKPAELAGRFAMCRYEIDGEQFKAYGIVELVLEQLELKIELQR
jgi:hypothetical protein